MRGLRRLAVALWALMALLCATSPSVAGAKAPESRPAGTSRAQLGLIGAYPNPDFALEFGLAVSQAGIEGEVTQSSSAYVDYGVATLLGAALGDLPTFQKAGMPKNALPLLSLPEAASADSRATRDIDRVPLLPHFRVFEGQLDPRKQPASKRIRDVVAALPTAYDEEINAGRETAHAVENEGSSKTKFNVMEIPHVLTYGPGHSETRITPKETTAYSYAKQLKIGPFVNIKDLEWRSGQVMGEEATASFTYSSAKINGRTYGPDDLAEMQAAAAGVNKSLDAWGIDFSIPTVAPTKDGGIEVTPLSFQFKDARLLAAVLGGPYQALLANDVNDLFKQGERILPETGLLFLVLNVVVGVITGYGGIKIQAGGVSSALGMKEVDVGEAAPPDDGERKTAPVASTSSGVSWVAFLVLGLVLAVIGLVDLRRLRAAFGRA